MLCSNFFCCRVTDLLGRLAATLGALWLVAAPDCLEADSARLEPVTWTCVSRVSEEMQVPLALVLAIMATEDGRVGRISHNKNGSWDIGPMQINSWWLPVITQAGITEDELLRDGCVNVAVAGWILRELMDKFDSPSKVIEAYHSLDPVHGSRYLAAVLRKAVGLDVDRLLLRVNETVPNNPITKKDEK